MQIMLNWALVGESDIDKRKKDFTNGKGLFAISMFLNV